MKNAKQYNVIKVCTVTDTFLDTNLSGLSHHCAEFVEVVHSYSCPGYWRQTADERFGDPPPVSDWEPFVVK